MIDDPHGDPSYPNLLASREELRNYSQDPVLCRSGASAKVGAVRVVLKSEACGQEVRFRLYDE